MAAAAIVPVYAMVDGATVLTFNDKGRDFGARDAAVRHLKERGFSVGPLQIDAPSGILFGAQRIEKYRNLTLLERARLHGSMTGPARSGPITVTIFAKAPHEVHVAARRTMTPTEPVDTIGHRAMQVALCGLFLFLALFGLLVFLPRPSSMPPRRAGAFSEQAFTGGPKIGLRAEALGRRVPIDEARR